MITQNNIAFKTIVLASLLFITNVTFCQKPKPEVLTTNPKEIKKSYIGYLLPMMNLFLGGSVPNTSHGLYYLRNWNYKLSTRASFDHLLIGNARGRNKEIHPTPFYYHFQAFATYSFLNKQKKIVDDTPVKSKVDGNVKTVTFLVYDGIVAKKLGGNIGFAKKHSYTGENGIGGKPIIYDNLRFNRSVLSVNSTMAIVGINYSRQIHAKVKYEGLIKDKNLDWRIYADIMPFFNRKKSYANVIVSLPPNTGEFVKTWTLEDLGLNPIKMGYRFGWERVYNGFGQDLGFIFGAEIARTNEFEPKAISFRTKLGLVF